MADIVERLCHRAESIRPWKASEAMDLSVIEEAKSEIERLRAATQWQPIVTAPKDGTWVLLLWPMTRTNVIVSGKYYISARDFEEMWLSQPPSVRGAHDPLPHEDRPDVAVARRIEVVRFDPHRRRRRQGISDVVLFAGVGCSAGFRV